MNKFKIWSLLWFIFVADVTSSSQQTIDPTAHIENTVLLGSYIRIAKGVIIKAHAQIKNYATIASDTLVAENSIIGEYVRLGERCTIQYNVNINRFATIGNDNVVGSDSVYFDYISSGNNVTFGNRLKVCGYARILANSEVNDDSILDKYSAIHNNGKIHQKVYIGKYSSIDENAIVKEWAVVHKYARVEKGSTVNESEVILRTPSSYELYLNAQNQNIPSAAVQIAAKDTGFISPEFNSLVKGLIDAQLNIVKTNCDKTNTSTKLDTLSSIKSLYLIRVHGLDRFKEYKQKVHNGMSNPLYRQLQDELHLCGASEINVLEPDVNKKFVQLLTIEQDDERLYRVENDHFCLMFAQIQKDERHISCAASTQTNKASSTQVNILLILFGALALWKFHFSSTN